MVHGLKAMLDLIATKKLMYNNDTKSAQDRKYNT
jgi:hypothetical protein